MLSVKTNRIDNTVGRHNGGLYGTLIMRISDDLFNVVALGSRGMPRSYAHHHGGVAQIAHNAATSKASPTKHGHAVHSPVQPATLCDVLH